MSFGYDAGNSEATVGGVSVFAADLGVSITAMLKEYPVAYMNAGATVLIGRSVPVLTATLASFDDRGA